MWENNQLEPLSLFFRLFKSTILVFEDKIDVKAKSVINLEGLIVKFSSREDHKSVILKHRDGYYAAKEIVLK